MKLETFFEKFEMFVDAPNAVAKMRELVLDLAATGKLCHNDSVGWKEGILGDVIELISGQHLLAHEHNTEGRGIPYLTGPSDFGEKSPIPTRWTDQPKVTAQPGDVLITVKGSGVGKTNVLVDQPTAISRQLMAIRITGADPEFVHVVLKRASEYFQNAKTGIAIPGIGRREVLGLKVILPPLAEQKRIVAKVDELMALCDRLEAQQQEREEKHKALSRASLARFADAPTPANLQFIFHPSYTITPADLRKSILTLAVQGKLVPQDPNDEPTVVSADIHLEGAFDVPESWTWTRLDSLHPEFQNGASSRGDRDGTPVVVIRLADVENRRISLDQPRSISISDEQIPKYRLLVGDTLITRVNGSTDLVGTFIPVQKPLNAIYCDHFIRMRIASNCILPDFTALIGDSQHVREQIKSLFITTAGQKTVNQGHIRSLCIPIPPLAEQRRIVAKVEELMKLVDALETQLAASRATAANLLAAIVAELTGTPNTDKASVPASTNTGTGRRGRPPKS